ncbi:hypothetical protein [Thiocapsa sp.]|uniref:hypothetical protein n=1 Tax=Thiocapsa sp. TaxID=2024551 RepID=UPI00359473B5
MNLQHIGVRDLDAVDGDLRQSEQAQELALVNHRLSIELKTFDWKSTEVGLVGNWFRSTYGSLRSGRALTSSLQTAVEAVEDPDLSLVSAVDQRATDPTSLFVVLVLRTRHTPEILIFQNSMSVPGPRRWRSSVMILKWNSLAPN